MLLLVPTGTANHAINKVLNQPSFTSSAYQNNDIQEFEAILKRNRYVSIFALLWQPFSCKVAALMNAHHISNGCRK